jgi:hypothetical protein
MFWINQVNENPKYPLDSFENGLAQELLQHIVKMEKIKRGKTDEKGNDYVRVGLYDASCCRIYP